MIVADANIIAYLLIEGDYSSNARALFALDDEWIVPQIWPHEFTNILATYAKTGGLLQSECLATWHDAFRLMDGRIVATNFLEAMDLAVRLKMSLYDAEYVHLAIERAIPLITEDKKLRDAIPQQAFSMKNYLAKAGHQP